MIKLVIFDAGELLFPLPRDLWAKKISELEEKYNVPKGGCAKAWGEVKPLIMGGEVNYLDAQEMIFKKAGFGENSRNVAQEWIEADNELRNAVQPFKGVKETLHRLKNDYKLAVLSDTHKKI